jgi:hypothetical protein
MYATRPTSQQTLVEFINLVHPGGPGWEKVKEKAQRNGQTLIVDTDGWMVPQGILCMVLGTVSIYGALLGTGYWIYGNLIPAITLTIVTLISSYLLIISWKKLLKVREE